MKSRPKSQIIHDEALKMIPGGVNSPVRSFINVGLPPMIVDEGQGDNIIDADGHQYIDYCGSWGALIHGHAHPYIVKRAIDRVKRGSTFGIASSVEHEMARKLLSLLPFVEKVRFVSSGTEATMSAIRLARAYTSKNLLVKFEGHYHGHADHLLVKGGSGLVDVPRATSAGVPQDVIKNTLTIPFNDENALKDLFSSNDDIAALIVEPVAANMGVVLPNPGFLQLLREETEKKGALLIFDEVITGLRINIAQMYNVKADMYTFGKIIGGGFPCAAFGGRQEIMNLLAPLGPVYQAGTLSGNPVAMEAGLATLELLDQPGFYEELERKTALLLDPIANYLDNHDLPCVLNRCGSMFTLFFGAKKADNFQRYDTASFNLFFQHLFQNGIYFSPSQYEANFVSSAHTDEHLVFTREIILSFLKQW